jgi:hypothetical protein
LEGKYQKEQHLQIGLLELRRFEPAAGRRWWNSREPADGNKKTLVESTKKTPCLGGSVEKNEGSSRLGNSAT